MSKHTAEAFAKMAAGPALQRILDRSAPVDDLIPIVSSHWGYDLYSRRPGPAVLENGVLKPTDLDLACFLSALKDRGAVINLPTYRARRARTEKEGEHVVSRDNRHGPVTGLVSNKQAFSFSVRITDHNVIVQGDEARGIKDSVGAHRNFMLVDVEGTWHDGWKKIEFFPSAKENAFLEDKSLWTGNTVHFENFIHPNRWISLYGQYYFLTKCLLQRVREEASHYAAALKEFPGPAVSDDESDEGPPRGGGTERGPSRPIQVTALEVEVDAPWRGVYPDMPTDVVSVTAMRDRVRRLRYTDAPELQFPLRATELAFAKAGLAGKGFPAWIKNAAWESGYTLPGKRVAANTKRWERLVMTQLVPGQIGYALRYRVWTKTEQVAPEKED